MRPPKLTNYKNLKTLPSDNAYAPSDFVQMSHDKSSEATYTVKNLANKKSIYRQKTAIDKTQEADGMPPSDGGAFVTAGTSNEVTQTAILYVDAGITRNDADSTSTSVTTTTATSYSASTASEPNLSDSGLSNGALAMLGIVGVGAVAAIAISSSKSSSSTQDTSAPTAQSINSIASSKSIVVTYSESLDANHLPLATSFFVTTNGAANPVSKVTVNGNVLTLTLTNDFSAGPLTISYTDPSAGNDLHAIQDLSGNDASGFIKGIVADGYISGARIYLDLNGDGLATENEFTGITTDQNGSFFLPSSLPKAAIISVGGKNIDTTLDQLTPLKAPAGSSTINPLTTLVQAVIEHAAANNESLTTDQAAAKVATVLNIELHDGLSLVNFNPLAFGDDAGGIQAQKIAAQLATIINIAAQSDPIIANTILGNVANMLAHYGDSNTPLDIGLLDQQQIQGILSDTGVGNLSAIASTIINSNTAISNATTVINISTIQSAVAEGNYRDTTAPLQLTVRLAHDTDTPLDNASYNGLIKVVVESDNLHTNTWEYSINGGSAWLAGSGDGFILPTGSYASGSILVRETDPSNNFTVSTNSTTINIDPPPTSTSGTSSQIDLLALAGGGFKAMAADAGMLAGVLKHYNTNFGNAENITLDSLLNDNMAISANSGSTWFVDLLAYSNSFVNSLNDYENLFKTDNIRGDDITTGGGDGFYGVMGEAYQNYLTVDIAEVFAQLQNDISGINNLNELVQFIEQSPVNLARILVAGAMDGGGWLLEQFSSIPGIDAISSKLASIFSGLQVIDPYIDAGKVAMLLGIDWNTFMQQVVFAPDNTDLLLKDINFYTNLDSHGVQSRTDVLGTQSLIYELAFSADQAAIGPKTKNGLPDNTVLATILNNEASYETLPSLPSFLSPDGTYNFIPATSTSLGSHNDVAAPWLPSIKSGDLTVKYDSAAFLDFGTSRTYTDLNLEGLSAFLSSSISSSAGALADSYGVLGDPLSVAGVAVNLLDVLSAGSLTDTLLNYTKGFAPLVQVPLGQSTASDPNYTNPNIFIDPINTVTSKAAADAGYLRMADGGYFDNSSVTSGLSYLEANQNNWIANDGIKDFEITLFVFGGVGESVSATLKDRGFSDDIGPVVERLFKDGKQQAVAVGGIDILDLSHPNSAVFESLGNVSGMTTPVWSYVDSTTTSGSGVGFAIKAFELGVKTFSGNTMNIGGGYEGTLNLWNIISDTGAIPLQPGGTLTAPESRNWNDYSIMYDQIIAGLQTTNSNHVGAELLADHLGYVI